MTSGENPYKTLLVEHLKTAVELELRAFALYGHMATFCRGVHRLTLAPFFEGEAAESVIHLGQVRQLLSDLGVEASTHYDLDFEFDGVSTMSHEDLLKIALDMETQAHGLYTAAHEFACELPLPTVQRRLEDLMDQERDSVLEVKKLLG